MGTGEISGLACALNAGMLTGLGQALAGTGAASTSYPGTVSTGTPGTNYYQKLDVAGHALTATYDLDARNTLKYIGSYRKMDYGDMTDIDGTTVTIYDTGRKTKYGTYSHEFQWIGNTERMNYVFGYYQFRDDGTSTSFNSGNMLTFLPPSFGPFGFGYEKPSFRVTTHAKAVFGQIDYKLTDALTATVGYRRTTEEKGGSTVRYTSDATGAITGFQCDSGTGPDYGTPCVPWTLHKASASSAATTPVLALAYRLNENVNIFGRMAKGFKGGGFSLEAMTIAGTQIPFQPERSTAYELGIKTNFWEGRGQFNATVFRTEPGAEGKVLESPWLRSRGGERRSTGGTAGHPALSAWPALARRRTSQSLSLYPGHGPGRWEPGREDSRRHTSHGLRTGWAALAGKHP